MFEKTNNQKGFALLLTLVVVSVVLAIGLSILDTTLKQLVLSNVAQQSEKAFHAAYAGAECAQYQRQQPIVFEQILAGANPILACLDQTAGPISNTHVNVPGGTVHTVTYQREWGPTSDRVCTKFDMYLLDTTTSGGNINYDFPGYYRKRCDDGNICTVIFSRGYNRTCNTLGTNQAIEREVVVQF